MMKNVMMQILIMEMDVVAVVKLNSVEMELYLLDYENNVIYDQVME
jgi:hypothetical protein